MSSALQVVRRLIEDVGDDFDVKDSLLKPDPNDVYAPHWEFVKAKARAGLDHVGKVNTTSFLYKNRHAGFFVKVFSDFGGEAFTVAVYDPSGDYIDATLIDVPDATGPWDAVRYAFPAAMDLIRDYSTTLWRKAAMGT